MKRILAALLAILLLLSAPASLVAANGTLAPLAYQTVWDTNGNPVSGAKICVYLAGTTTATTTWTEVTLTTPNSNPIIADTSGRFVAFLQTGASYKFAFQDATGTANTCDGAPIKTVDNVAAVPGSSANLDIVGVAGETLTAGQAVYLSDGSGSKTPGLWYKADSANPYSSTLLQVGMVPAAIASGGSGSVRLAGTLPGLTGLTIGAPYYVGTAGAITTTPPTNRRALGEADTTSSLVLLSTPPLAGPGSAATLTIHGIVLGQATSAVTATAALTTGQLLVGVTGADPVASAAATAGASLVLLKANSGTDTSAGATNVDTIAITGLTAKDQLIVEVSGISVTQATAGLLLYNGTDAVTLVNLASGGALAAGEVLMTRDITTQSQASTTSIWSFTKGRTTIAGAAENITIAAVTQAWTGAWNLVLRHTGVTAGGTLQWKWAVYKLAGQ